MSGMGRSSQGFSFWIRCLGFNVLSLGLHDLGCRSVSRLWVYECCRLFMQVSEDSRD